MREQKSYYAKPEDIKKKWVLIDVKDQILGRVASEIASLIRGKTKVDFTPSMDVGEFVVVINADKVVVSGKKAEDKKYYHHTGYPKGLRCLSYKQLKEKDPTQVLSKAIWGMLPKNKIGRKMFKNLKIYSGEEHPHKAQNPEIITLPLKKGGK
ncbi:50S ribosomal protein L13 [Candidatus Margulisiibacteriota bacterium]